MNNITRKYTIVSLLRSVHTITATVIGMAPKSWATIRTRDGVSTVLDALNNAHVTLGCALDRVSESKP